MTPYRGAQNALDVAHHGVEGNELIAKELASNRAKELRLHVRPQVFDILGPLVA